VRRFWRLNHRAPLHARARSGHGPTENPQKARILSAGRRAGLRDRKAAPRFQSAADPVRTSVSRPAKPVASAAIKRGIDQPEPGGGASDQRFAVVGGGAEPCTGTRSAHRPKPAIRANRLGQREARQFVHGKIGGWARHAAPRQIGRAGTDTCMSASLRATTGCRPRRCGSPSRPHASSTSRQSDPDEAQFEPYPGLALIEPGNQRGECGAPNGARR